MKSFLFKLTAVIIFVPMAILPPFAAFFYLGWAPTDEPLGGIIMMGLFLWWFKFVTDFYRKIENKYGE